MKKRNLKLMVGTFLLSGLVAVGSVSFAAESSQGSEAALNDTSYTLEEMLTYAIQDEYYAQAQYNALMDSYGVIRPFSNIVGAEQTHINLLLSLFAAYDFEVPENNAADRVTVPDTLVESYEAGVTGEEDNIAMYEAFLKEDLPADVQFAFERLEAASQMHLYAFENAASGTGYGAGYGNGAYGNGTNGNVTNGGGMGRGRGAGATGQGGYGGRGAGLGTGSCYILD